MRTPPLPADYLCQGLQTNLRKTLDTTGEIGDVVAIFRVIHVSYQQTQIAPAIGKYLQREYTK